MIGLELHVQLKGNVKLLSPSKALYEAPPNSQVTAFDAALPGSLPVGYCYLPLPDRPLTAVACRLWELNLFGSPCWLASRSRAISTLLPPSIASITSTPTYRQATRSRKSTVRSACPSLGAPHPLILSRCSSAGQGRRSENSRRSWRIFEDILRTPRSDPAGAGELPAVFLYFFDANTCLCRTPPSHHTILRRA